MACDPTHARRGTLRFGRTRGGRVSELSRFGAADVAGLAQLAAQYPCRPYYYYRELDDAALTAHFLATLEAAFADPENFGLVDGAPAGGFVVAGPRRWESHALGIYAGSVGPVVVAAGPDAADVRARLLAGALAELSRRGVRHVTMRLDTNELELLHLCEVEGFITLDTVLHLYRDLAAAPPQAAAVACRPHIPSDVARLRDIARGAYRFDRLHADPVIDPHRADAAYAEWITNSCNGLDDVVLVAEERGEPVGFMTVRTQPLARRLLQLEVAKIWLVGIAASARGRGVGQALLESVAAWCQARGIRDLEIGTQLRNTAALKLYGRAGFVAANAVSAVRRLLP